MSLNFLELKSNQLSQCEFGDNIIMRGQRDICLLCRHALKPSSPFGIARRSASRKGEPYVLPRLIIDLDASDSKFVRKAEELEEDGQEAPNPRAQVKPRKHRFRKIAVKEDGPKIPFKPETITSPDLLQYALLGDRHVSPTHENDNLQRKFKERMLHPNDKVDTKVEQLILDFTTDSTQNLAKAGFSQGQEAAVLEEIRACDSFTNLQRMIPKISSSVEGCKFLAEYGHDVVERIRLCRKAQQEVFQGAHAVSATAVLSLLNNLHLNVKSKGLDFPPSLCNAGLYYASKIFNLPAVRMYLQELSEMSYSTNWHTDKALQKLQQHIVQTGKKTKACFPWLNNSSRDVEFIKLMTGWASPSGPTPGEERQLSFADLLSHSRSTYFKDRTGYREDLYRTYVLGLGEMGLTEILWHEWSTPDLTRISERYIDDRYYQARVQIFTVAFLLAKDIERALSVFNSMQWTSSSSSKQFLEPPIQPSAAPSGETGTGDELRKEAPLMQRLILYHYHFHNLYPSDKLLSIVERESLVKKQNPRDRPEETLKAIARLLLTGFRSSDWNRLKLTLDWVSVDGEEGLLVMSESGNHPSYFKRATQSESRKVIGDVEQQNVHEDDPGHVNTERIDS